jgi:cytochrome b561
MTPTERTHYDPLSRAFHWITALAVLVAFVLGPDHFGRMMRQGVDPATRLDIVWHESLGLLVFALTLVRLLWLAIRPRAPRFAMPAWMTGLSHAVHALLWAMLLALPVSAMLALGGEGHPLTLLGGIRVDQMPLIAQSSLAHALDWGDVHEFLGDAIVWLAGLHAVAALIHHAVLRDGVLRAMLPPGRTRG